MRIVAVLLLIGVLGLAAMRSYRSHLREAVPPTSQMQALGQHFQAKGLQGSVQPARHGYSTAVVVAAAKYRIDGYPLPVVFEQCATEAQAQEHVRTVSRQPNVAHAQRNGTLVMSLPMWGADTGTMTAKVTAAFDSFKPVP